MGIARIPKHRALMVLAALAIVAVGVGVGAAVASRDGSSTGRPTEVLGETHTRTSAAAATSTTSPTVGPCRNSLDPACGDFAWDPLPSANRTATLDATLESGAPSAGDELSITVTAQDPDARDVLLAGVMWGDRPDEVVLDPRPVQCVSAFGTWDAPPASPGALETTLTHAYERSGTYTVTVYVVTYRAPAMGEQQHGVNVCDDPYGDGASAELTVTVG